MAITLDSIDSYIKTEGTGQSNGSATIAIDGATGNSLVVVHVTLSRNPSRIYNDVLLDGVSADFLEQTFVDGGVANTTCIAIWKDANVPSAGNYLLQTDTNGSATWMDFMVYQFDGVDQTTSNSSVTYNTVTGISANDTVSVTLSGQSGEYVLAFGCTVELGSPATGNDTTFSANLTGIDLDTGEADDDFLDVAQIRVTGAFDASAASSSEDYDFTFLEAADSVVVGAIAIFAAAGAATAAITGTAVATIDEADIVAGGKTIIITLTGDTFKAAGTGPIGSTADTQALIDGFDAVSSPTNGWNNEVRDKALTSEIVRTSSTVATWTIAAQAGYDISAQEVITGTIPTDVLVIAAGAITATPTFTIDAVAVGGDLLLTNRSIANYGGIRQ